MISDGVNNGTSNQSNNFWQSTGTGGAQDSIVVPVGVFGATDVWTMLDNSAGNLGGNDTTVTFDFGATSNATSGLTVVTVALNNNNNTPLNGELRAAMSCTAGTSTCFTTGPNPRGTLAQGTVIDGVTLNEGVVYNTFSYNSVPATSPFYTGSTAGKAKLDDQQFVFNNPTLSNEWLVSMTVTENAANTFASPTPSQTALSAITVDTAAVPEPGSVLLLLSGIGGLGFMRFRRRNGSTSGSSLKIQGCASYTAGASFWFWIELRTGVLDGRRRRAGWRRPTCGFNKSTTETLPGDAHSGCPVSER